ncbi:YybH family protein [Ferrimonas gelatinilytica]|uniref:SnoaL-like domain-containing protein n=1 Tax=Ferrimonas gelatinilytica TaxID=1255257 RepID=A0ABP9RY88_9GAMM
MSLRHILFPLLLITSLPSHGSNIDDLLNPIYDQFVDAYQTLNADPLVARYSNDACMMGVSEREGFYEGREAIREAYQRWFDKVRQREATIDIRFRVVNRTLRGDMATDAGYYLIRYQPNQENEKPASEFAGKFIMNFHRESDDYWSVSVDSATRVKTELFTDAKPQPGLYFAPTFETMAVTPNHETTQ